MGKNKRYHVIDNKDIIALELDIKTFEKAGWSRIGKITFIDLYDPYRYRLFYQVMVKQ